MKQISTSDFYNHAIRIKENMTLDDASTGEPDDCNIVTEAATLIFDDSVTLTVGDGKTLIPDLYNVYRNSPKY